MASAVKFYSFAEAIAEETHNFASDTFKVALTNSAPTQSNTVLANITEISYTNISDRAITTSSSGQTTGTQKVVFATLVLTASGNVPDFRYVVVYNDTAANDELVCYYDFGSTVSLISGDTFTIAFDGTSGFLQLS